MRRFALCALLLGGMAGAVFSQAPRPPVDELSRLRDVTITSPTNAQVLSYDSGLTKWKNSSAGAGTGDFSTNTSTSVVGELVLFANTGGKLGKRSTGSGILKLTSGVSGFATGGTDYEFPLTFSDSLSRTSNTVTLVGDSATPGASQYYGTNGGSVLGYYPLPTSAVWGSITGTLSDQTDLQTALNAKQNTLTIGNLTDAGTDGLTVTGGTGAVIGSGTSLSQHVSDTTHNGYLSSTDWNTFNGKQSALTLGNFTDAGTDGITVTGGTGSVVGSGTSIAQHVADTTHNGYLSSVDWNTFNGKSTVTPAALTKTDDTNVTLTLGGTPNTALLQATSITVGWSGTLAVARGGTGSGTASGARTNLGATTTGGNIFTVTDPSAITFLKVNADNSVTLENAATFRSDIGAGTGGGSVTSVGLSSPNGSISLGGTNPVTTSGTINVDIASSANLPGNPTTTTQSSTDNSTRVATTSYVTTGISNAVAGVNPAVAVQAATTAAGDTSGFTYSNGVGGIGATLTGPTANTAVTIDGYTFTALGQRLLVKNDTQSPSGAFNGVYYVTTLQAIGIKPVLTRSLDYDQPSDINNTGSIPVVNGTVNANTSWLLTSSVTTVGTDPLTYTQFSINPTNLVQTSRTLTIGGTAQDLSADRSWLGNVTNDTQTKSAIVPNTAPSAGQILAGNAGGTAYAPVTLSGSGATATLSSAGVLTLSAIPNATLSNSSITIAGTSTSLGGTITLDTISGVSSNGFLKRTGANTWTNDSSTYLTGNQTITLSGDVTGSGATAITTVLGNIPDVTTAAGSILFTDISAPSSPAAAHLKIFGDSTDLRFHDKNAAGTIGTTVVADTGSSNNFLTAISASGVISKAQPTDANLSLSDITTNNSATAQHGFLKKLDNTATHYMDGTGNWSTPAGTGVTSVATTSPISGGTITTTGTISFLNNVDLAETAAQTITLTNATTNAVDDLFTLDHESSGTPANGLGGGINFKIQDSTTANQSAAKIQAAWSTVTHASRASYLDFQASSSGNPASVARLFGSGGLSVNSTTDPGAGIINANTGFRVGNAATTAHVLRGNGTNFVDAALSASDVGLGNVTNNAQTQSAVVPNTAPSSGQILVGNAGGTAYAPQTLSGSGATATLSSAGVLTLSAIANATLTNSSITIGGVSTALGGTVLGNVTNDAQTKAAIVPNTAPAAGDILVGNAGGTAYAHQALSGSGVTATLSSSGVLTLSAIPNATLTNSAITIAGTSTSLGGTITQDTITGLGSTGIVKRSSANTLGIATSGTDYLAPTTVPTVRAVSAIAHATSGTVTANLPSGHTTNDILLLFIQHNNLNTTPATPSGYTVLHEFGQDDTTTAGIGIAVFWKRDGGSESAPTFTVPANHASCTMMAVVGCPTTGDPVHFLSNGWKRTASTSASITGGTTTLDNCLVTYVTMHDISSTSGQYSAEANSSLTNITEQIDTGTTDGVGGGMMVTTGTLATAGATGALTATIGSSTKESFMSFAMIPSGTTQNNNAPRGAEIKSFAFINASSYTAPAYTWAKPIGAKSCTIIGVGGGGAGGAGRSASTACGSGGGGGGALSTVIVQASDLASTATVTPGAGGIGGSTKSAATASTFASGSITLISAGLGTLGADAATGASGQAGPGGSSYAETASGGTGIGGQGGAGALTNGVSGNKSAQGGGGGGAGTTTGNTGGTGGIANQGAGGGGGGTISAASGGGGGGGGGSAGGGTHGAGTDSAFITLGAGGGGGGDGTVTTGGAGGFPGGGGGGGGNATTSGGNGGAGVITVITYF